jgi:hypothetical protein
MEEQITPEKLDALDALREQATELPWRATFVEFANSAPAWCIEMDDPDERNIVEFPDENWHQNTDADSHYIVACCNAESALTAALRQAWAERDSEQRWANEYHAQVETLTAANARLERERDEARSAVIELWSIITVIPPISKQTEKMIADLVRNQE